MEAATAPPTETTDPAPAAEPEEVATPVAGSEKEPQDKLFRYSTFVDVGEGAEECGGGSDFNHPEDMGLGHKGMCNNPDHAHFWVRLANQFQHETLRNKALAHKARVIRQFNDPEADRYAILEGELDEIRSAPNGRDFLIDDLVQREFLANQKKAVDAVADEEEFAHIMEDMERLTEIDAQDPEERNDDEYNELTKHVSSYHDRVEKEREALEAPLREALEAKDTEDLLRQIRGLKVEAEATKEFMEVYSRWQWVLCTFHTRDPAKGRPNERVFSDLQELRDIAPETMEYLHMAFTDLEGAVRTGN